jgi:integrase
VILSDYPTEFLLAAARWSFCHPQAIALRRSDVNWEDGVLTIRGGKFGKSRMVPVHGTTLKVLRDYARHRDRHLREGWRGEKVSDAGDLFFVSNRGTALSGPWLRASFRVRVTKTPVGNKNSIRFGNR